MYIEDFFGKIFGKWRVLVLALGVWLVGAGVFLLVFPKQWEASGYLQIGTFGGKPVENGDIVRARLRSRGVLSAVLDKNKLSTADSAVERLHRWMRVRLIGDRYLELSVKAHSRSEAMAVTTALLQGIKDEQNKLLARDVNASKSLMQFYQKQQALLWERFERRNTGRTANLTRFLMLNMANKYLNQQIALRNALQVPQVQNTVVLGAVYAPRPPVFPNPVIVWAFAILMGFATGIIWIFGTRSEVAQPE